MSVMKQQIPSLVLFLATASLAIFAADGRGLRHKKKATSALGADNAHVRQVTEAWRTPGSPDVVGFMDGVRTALEPFERDYLKGRGEWPGNVEDVENKQAGNVYSAFARAVDKGMANSSLNLLKKLGPPRSDDSIFLSIASYRDTSCGPTLKRAFQRAKNPEKLFVGIVQMNCERQCMTGTGWGETRRWVPAGPDPDCAMEFCTSSFGKPICDEGHVRMVRLEEKDALGPYFSRFLNSRLYRAESYFMQIDSHTNFRQDWDETMVSQIRRTPNYPRAIISNYPPSGTAEDKYVWEKFDGKEQENSAGLCRATFEGSGNAASVRFDRTDADEPKGDALSPPFSCFIAAGFFFGGAQLVDEVPFDPYMPWIFMGEELAFTIRFWTSGFDIHRPAADVVRHEYVRSEHPKFWESVNMIFSDPSMHNDLTAYILPRLHHLLTSGHSSGTVLASARSSLVDPASSPLGDYSIGSNRSRQAFFSLVGMDVDKQVSEVPDWYTQSKPPPERLRLLAGGAADQSGNGDGIEDEI